MTKKRMISLTLAIAIILSLAVLSTLMFLNTALEVRDIVPFVGSKKVLKVSNVEVNGDEFRFYCNLVLTDDNFISDNMYNPDFGDKVKDESVNYVQDYICRLKVAEKDGYTLTKDEKNEVIGKINETYNLHSNKMKERKYYNYYYGITKKQYTNFCLNWALINKATKSETDKADPNESNQRLAYEKYKEYIERVQVRYMSFVLTTSDGTTLSESEIQAKRIVADEIKAKINAGEDMNDLAKEYKSSVTPISDEGVAEVRKKDSSGELIYDQKLIDWTFSATEGQVGVVVTKDEILVLKVESKVGLEQLLNEDELKAAAQIYVYEKKIQDEMKNNEYKVIKYSKEFQKLDITGMVEETLKNF